MKGKKIVLGPQRSKWAWLSVVLLGGILMLSLFDIRESSRELKASEVMVQSHMQVTMHAAETDTIGINELLLLIFFLLLFPIALCLRSLSVTGLPSSS